VVTAVTYDAAKAAPIAMKVNRGISVLRWGLP
jgi:hypothetical protein